MSGATGRWALAWTLALLATSDAEAVKPSVWRNDTQGAFSKGEPENISITTDGQVTLAPLFEEIAVPDVENVWCLVEDARGDLYAGTGNSGKVLRISPKGEVSVLFDSPEVGIQSLAFDGKGNLYAGSSPDGLVYRIAPDGTATSFCMTGETYVWALAFGPDGDLYAGTGIQGKILRISSKGDAEEIYRAPDPHVMCLISDAEGNLYAGTEGSGIVYRIEGEGPPRVLYDAAEREIHTLAMGRDGVLYAGAIPGSPREPSGPEPPQREPPRPEPAGQGVIYRIEPSGAVDRLWSSSEHLLLSMAVTPRGNLVVGTGDRGFLFEVTPEGKGAELAKCRDEKPLCMLVDHDGHILVGTGAPGGIHRLTSSYAEEGTFTSEAHDHKIVSNWGRISWRAEVPEGTRIACQTRSGNTEEPDDTWSGWSKELKRSGERIPSPPGRFLQYRATLSTSDGSRTPALKEVSLTGAQENLRPRVTSIQCHPYVGTPSRGNIAPPSSERQVQKRPLKRGLRMIKWDAEDPNGDDLTYSIFLRGIEERDWRPLEEDLRTRSYMWDTESAPDGTSQIRIVASDRSDNPPAHALSGEIVSKPFEVDNTAPTIRNLSAAGKGPGRIAVRGIAEDATSFVRKGEYAVDAGTWQVILPEDRIFDSGREPFEFAVENLEPGEHAIVVRMTDALENVGTARVIVDVEE